ncbi:hypothetical protein POX82_22155 [Escherichia coli]
MKKPPLRNTGQTINLAELIDDMSEEVLITLHNLIVNRLNMLQRQRTRQSMGDFRLGDVVSFRTEDGQMVTGVLVRLNKKTVTVHTESGARWNVSPQLLQDCYDYMEAFKQVMDSTSKVQMDYICLQYPGYFRFAKWMERLAQGIADGVIEVPKDH